MFLSANHVVTRHKASRKLRRGISSEYQRLIFKHSTHERSNWFRSVAARKRAWSNAEMRFLHLGDIAAMKSARYTEARSWYLPLWCKWLTRRPLKAETTGSSPVSGTFLFNGYGLSINKQ